MFQVLSWWLCHKPIQLCSTRGHFVLQTPLLPAFQGERKLQPSYQVCINETCSSLRSTGLNCLKLWFVFMASILFPVCFFSSLISLVENWQKTWSSAHFLLVNVGTSLWLLDVRDANPALVNDLQDVVCRTS